MTNHSKYDPQLTNQHHRLRQQELPTKRPRFTFSDEPNEPPGPPVLQPPPSEKAEAQGNPGQAAGGAMNG